jgi:hypothetical protein
MDDGTVTAGDGIGISGLGIAALPRLLAVEVLLAEPEALQDDVPETCLYLLRDKLKGASPGAMRRPALLPRTLWRVRPRCS